MSAVAVIGAGIGGLSTAAALAAEGHTVTLLERAKSFGALGAGLLLTPNAIQPLARLGVALAGAGQVLSRLEMCGRGGRLLSAIELAHIAEDYGPSYAIARCTLHKLLAKALPPSVEILLGAEVSGIREVGRAVSVRWSGLEREFDAVVAADGLHSAVRGMLGGPMQLRYSGNRCWRGIVPLEGVGSVATESLANGSRVGVVPVGADKVYYYLVRVSADPAPSPATLAQLRTLFPGHAGVAGRLLEALTELPALHHYLYEVHKPFWGRGRVLLLGDAAHSMTPNQGQGAAMAIEDALAVAEALRDGPDGALERYRRARHTRVRKVQLDSRRIGTLANLRGPGVAWLREALMRLAPAGAVTTVMRRLVAAGPISPTPTPDTDNNAPGHRSTP